MLTPEELQKLQQAGIGEKTTSPSVSLSQRLGIKTKPDVSMVNKPAGQVMPGPVGSVIKTGADIAVGLGNALTSSEQAFGQDIAAAASQILPKSLTGIGAMEQGQQMKQQGVNNLLNKIREVKQQGGDTSRLLKVLGEVTGQPVTTEADLYPALKKSNLQVVGDAAGTLLDILSSGSYGSAAKGAKTGELLAKTEQATTPVVKQALGQTLKGIATKTGERALVGAGTGYAYDVAGNLQQGKEGTEALTPGYGTLLGGAIPAVIGGVQAGVAITKETAPRFINSLIKPKQANFSYGKDPGKTVSEMGITGNSLPDFEKNISKAKQDIGSQIGEVYANPANANLQLDLSDEIKKFDDAIAEAAKGGKSNQSIVTALQNAKDALLFEHTVNAEGVIEKTGSVPRDLTKLNPQEAFDLKQLVSGQTKFTGNPSDDKAVNSVLKDVYGGIKDTINRAVEKNNPEITDLNEKYAGLTSAELATRNRDMIVKRADQISMPVKVGGATALITAISTGGAAIPALLAGAGAAALDKALASTAVKTRVAAWLGSESPSTISKVLQQNPEIKTVLYRVFPKLASQLNSKKNEQ